MINSEEHDTEATSQTEPRAESGENWADWYSFDRDYDEAKDRKLARLRERFRAYLGQRPEYAKIADELEAYTKTGVSDDPGSYPLEEISKTIGRIQRHKDRVAFLKTKSIRDVYLWKSLLKDVELEIGLWVAAVHRAYPATRSSANKEARFNAALPYVPAAVRMLYEYVEEALMFAQTLDDQIDTVFRNLRDAYEAVSRQLTVIQEQRELGELTRSDRKRYRRRDEEEDDGGRDDQRSTQQNRGGGIRIRG